MKLKKDYIAPGLTVVSFKMEQGYATSVVLATLGDLQIGIESAVDQTNLYMGDQMADLTNDGGTNGYFGYGGTGTGIGDDGLGNTWF